MGLVKICLKHFSTGYMPVDDIGSIAPRIDVRYPLNRTFIVLFALLVVAPIVITAAFIGLRHSRDYEQGLVFQSLEALKQSRFGITAITNDVAYFSKQLFWDPAVKRISNPDISYQTRVESLRSLDFTWGNLLDSKPAIKSIALLRKGETLAFYGIRASSENQEHLEKAYSLGGTGFWAGIDVLDTRMDAPVLEPVLSYYRDIRDLEDQRSLSIVRISIMEKALTSVYLDLNPFPEGVISILDDEGRVLSSSDKSRLAGSEQGQPYWATVVEHEEGTFRTRIDDLSLQCFFYSLEDPAWKVVQLVPSEVFSRQSTPLLIFSSVAFFACLLFAALFIWFLEARVILPIRQLALRMENLRSGEGMPLPELQENSQGQHREPNRGGTELDALESSFRILTARLDHLIDKVLILGIQEKEAKLRTLEAQINPHFLYNTLDTLRWMSLGHGDATTAAGLESLSSVFKYALAGSARDMPIEEELRNLNDYVSLQRLRFGDRLCITIEAAPELLPVRIPRLIVQPLVENAIVHGVEPVCRPVSIAVELRQDGHRLAITVNDDGAGAQEDEVLAILDGSAKPESYSALRNIQGRLTLRYGQNTELCIATAPGQGFRTALTIPLEGVNQ